MKRGELEDIIKKHIKWLNDENSGERANLSYVNLSSANLRSVDLSSANLYYADLSYADLSYANLSSANLRYADLSYANLSFAKLSKKVIVINGVCKWSLRFNEYDKDGLIRIGCEYKTEKEWNKWFKSKEEFETKRSNPEFLKIKIAYDTMKKLLKIEMPKKGVGS